MIEPLDIRLDAIDTTLSELSFAETTASGISAWAADLPLANIAQTAAQLKLATAELALLDHPGEDKLNCLEAIRPLIHYICARLDRGMQGSAKNMRESDSQRLMLNLCSGYKDVLMKTAKLNPSDTSVMGQAIHRLISDLSRILLRAQQLYVSPPSNFWWELNELFRIADALEINEFTLQDDENNTDQELSITDAYLRALLLATCKHNQLQASELSAVFNALESWTKPVGLHRDPTEALLIIDLMSNLPPQYANLAGRFEDPRGLNTEVLAYELEAYLNNVDGQISVPPTLTRSLLRHLVDAWSVLQPRGFGRFATQTPVRVAVGLRATHYFLSGGCHFNDQISNTDELLRREVNPFLDVAYEPNNTDSKDPWSQAHDLKVRIPVNPNIEAPERILLEKPAAEASRRDYSHFETCAVDTSPGGYRLEWLEDLPPNARVGELIALREEKAARWCVALIRWIRQEQQRICMGVELLSPRAIPVAIRAIQKRGGPTGYTRGLLLPQIEAIGQESTLITPSVPFVEKQKVNLQRQGIQTTAQLLLTRLKTESVNQFTFRMLDGYLENNRNDSNIDGLSAMTREDTSQGP